MSRRLLRLVVALTLLIAGPAGPAAATTTPAPVVLIGVGGVRWSDVDPAATPALHSLATQGAIGDVAVRSVRTATCPVDGWLTISAGRRAAEQEDAKAPVRGNPPCRPMTPAADGRIEAWPRYLAAAGAESYGATPGLLGDALDAAGVCATAVGPGAQIALARSNGTLAAGPAPGSCPLTVVDAGAVRDPADAPQGTAESGVATVPGGRAAQVAALDDRVARALADAPTSTRVLVVSLADAGLTPHLTLLGSRGPGYGPGWVRSSSTRQVALVQLTDITPTVLELLGVQGPALLVGSPVRGLPAPDQAPASVAHRLEKVLDLDRAARAVAALVPTFFTGLVAAQLLLYGAAAIALRRRWASGPGRDRVLRMVRRVALVFAAVPVSTYLANTVSWWRHEHPLLVIVLVVTAYLAAVSLVAQLGPWRRLPLGPFGAVAGLTSVILAADISTGSRLQISSLMGLQPVVAGRFYGFSNVTYALFATGGLLLTVAVADHLVTAGRRRLAGLSVAVLGVVVTVLDVAPRWGSDFGGPIALVPAFAVLALLVLGVRLSIAKAGVIAVGTVVLLTVVSVVDWLRPAAERTHLGRFVQTVIDGGALQVVGRKADQNLTILFGSVLSVLVPVGALFVALVLLRPSSWGAPALARAYERSPTLRQGLACLLVLLGIGFAVNDSGTAIPAIGAMLAIPLLIAASMRALEDDEPASSAEVVDASDASDAGDAGDAEQQRQLGRSGLG